MECLSGARSNFELLHFIRLLIESPQELGMWPLERISVVGNLHLPLSVADSILSNCEK